MIKALGALCILSGSILVMAEQLIRKRQDLVLLRELIRAFRAMEVAIRWKGQTVPECLKTLENRPFCGAYFTDTFILMESGFTLQSSWNQVFQSVPADLRDILLQMDWSGDEQHLLENLQYMAQALSTLYEQRQISKRNENRLLIATIGSVTGVLIVILL